MSCPSLSCYDPIARTTTDREDYPFDWSDYPEAADITGYSFEVVGDPALTVESQSRTGSLTVAWLEGGTSGVTAELRSTIEGMNGPEPFRFTRSRLIETRLSVGVHC